MTIFYLTIENVNNDAILSLNFITNLLQTINFYNFYQCNSIFILYHSIITSSGTTIINNDEHKSYNEHLLQYIEINEKISVI